VSKPYFLILFLFNYLPETFVFVQGPDIDYRKADSLALLDYEIGSVKDLSHALSAQLTTDAEKARAFFMWLAENIRYDCRKFHNPQQHEIRARSEEDYKKKLEVYRQEQLEKILQKKRGICSDYSRLFKMMCDYSGLEAVVISGNARDFYKPNKSALNNSHAWNAVKIDGEWRLLDATWAAGYANAEVTRFTKKLKPGYFFPPPEWLLQTHFPNEDEWQLMDAPISKIMFADQPMVNFGQYDHRLLDFAPKAEMVNGKKHIWFVFEQAPKSFFVTTPKGKLIKFDQFEKDGRVYLAIHSTHVKRVNVYTRDSQRRKGDWLCMYPL
jgi:transglutaminase/protease-like cytokinesis protein 3